MGSGWRFPEQLVVPGAGRRGEGRERGLARPLESKEMLYQSRWRLRLFYVLKLRRMTPFRFLQAQERQTTSRPSLNQKMPRWGGDVGQIQLTLSSNCNGKPIAEVLTKRPYLYRHVSCPSKRETVGCPSLPFRTSTWKRRSRDIFLHLSKRPAGHAGS